MVCLAVLAGGSCIGAAAGLWPWLHLTLTAPAGGGHDIGAYVQIGVAVFLGMLLVYLPANLRMRALERSHRNFAIGMDDVTRAYRIAHAADRAQMFTLSGQFDAMRSRMDHLHAHPDLRDLEPELLQLAAQMSVQSRHLAQTYADDKVERARQFLQQRQQDIDLLTARISQAQKICDELRLWSTDIDIEERTLKKQLRALDAQLQAILPTLGYDFDFDDPRLRASEDNVVSLPKGGKLPA